MIDQSLEASKVINQLVPFKVPASCFFKINVFLEILLVTHFQEILIELQQLFFLSGGFHRRSLCNCFFNLVVVTDSQVEKSPGCGIRSKRHNTLESKGH